MGLIMKNGIPYGGGGAPATGTQKIEGYLNSEDGKFYAEDTYQTELTPNADNIYVDLASEEIYRYSTDGDKYIKLCGTGQNGEIETAYLSYDVNTTTFKYYRNSQWSQSLYKDITSELDPDCAPRDLFILEAHDYYGHPRYCYTEDTTIVAEKHYYIFDPQFSDELIIDNPSLVILHGDDDNSDQYCLCVIGMTPYPLPTCNFNREQNMANPIIAQYDFGTPVVLTRSSYDEHNHMFAREYTYIISSIGDHRIVLTDYDELMTNVYVRIPNEISRFYYLIKYLNQSDSISDMQAAAIVYTYYIGCLLPTVVRNIAIHNVPEELQDGIIYIPYNKVNECGLEEIFFEEINNQYFDNKRSKYFIEENVNNYGLFDDTQTYHNGDIVQHVVGQELDLYQFVHITPSQWNSKTWTGLTSFDGNYIWTDGEDIYYSYGTDQYIFDKSTSTWSAKTWTGLTSFDGTNIWTDGEEIYYSHNAEQYILFKSANTWEAQTWSGLTEFDGYRIWHLDNKVYYSDSSEQYYLDIDNENWVAMTWKGLTSFSGNYIWFAGNNVYYNHNGVSYQLNNSQRDTWFEKKDWVGLTDFEGDYVWADGENIYYSKDDQQYFLVNTNADIGPINRWGIKIWNGLTDNIQGYKIWSIGDNVYYSQGSTKQLILDKSHASYQGTWNDDLVRYITVEDMIEDSSMVESLNVNSLFDESKSYFPGSLVQHIDIDGKRRLYRFNEDVHGVVNNKTWNGFTSIVGRDIWTDGENIYYSFNNSQYILDKSTSTWVPTTWWLTFSGRDIWTDGENIYLSDTDGWNGHQYIFDKSTSTWTAKTWNGFAKIDGNDIWTDGNNVYYSSGSKQYILDKSTSTWTVKTWNGLTNFYGSGIWTDGDNIYHSSGSKQYVLDKSTSTWTAKTWNGLTEFAGPYIWTDGDNIYYSSGDEQYILDKSTSTWSEKTWIGFTDFFGEYIWTDGDNIYYSSDDEQYILDKSTSTWSEKTWIGFTDFFGEYIWTDGDNIYYSSDDEQYILDKSTSTWSEKTWNGLTEIDGDYIWTDGENVYFSKGDKQYVLDKLTSTWLEKIWNGFAEIYGDDIWTDGDNIYYSHNYDHYILAKSASTWMPVIYNVDDFNGYYIWTDGENSYYSQGADQYIFTSIPIYKGEKKKKNVKEIFIEQLINETGQKAESYADEIYQRAKSYANDVEENANSYTDSAEERAKSYTDTAIQNAITSALNAGY